MKVPYKVYYTGTFINCQAIGKFLNSIVSVIQKSLFYFSGWTIIIKRIMVRAVVPGGKRAGAHTGQVAVRTSGSFNVSAAKGRSYQLRGQARHA